MNPKRFDSLLAALPAAPSRRTALSVLGGLSLAGLLGPAEARKKKRRKKKQTCPTCPTCVTCPSPLPSTGPGKCGSFPVGDSAGSQERWAQTFLPPQGGQLKGAIVFLQNNPANFALVFEIRAVDGAGVPTNTILSSKTVFNILATTNTDPPLAVLASFASPATLTLGQPYALSITGPNAQYRIIANTAGNFCPDGKLFADASASGNFVAVEGGAADLVYLLDIG